MFYYNKSVFDLFLTVQVKIYLNKNKKVNYLLNNNNLLF